MTSCFWFLNVAFKDFIGISVMQVIATGLRQHPWVTVPNGGCISVSPTENLWEEEEPEPAWVLQGRYAC